MSLTFKKGSLTNFNTANFNKDDFCFVTNSTGTMGTIRIIKDASKNYYGLMPDFGTDNDTGKALISQGSTSSPTYATLGISGGGTGAVSLTKNRLLYVNNTVFSTANHYIDNNQVQINQTEKFTTVNAKDYLNLNKLNNTSREKVRFFVNGVFAMDGDIIPINSETASFNYSLGTEKNKWKRLYCESIIGNNGASYRNGNEEIAGEDKTHAYEIKTLTDGTTQVKTDLEKLISDYGIRIDTRISNLKNETTNWVPPKSSSNANTVITINRYSGTTYLTQFGLNSTGVYYRSSAGSSIYGQAWKQILYKADPQTSVGGTKKFVYVGSDGGVVATSATVGSNSQFIYMSGGTMTASTASVGNGTTLMHLSKGVLTASTATLGSACHPVYLSNGSLTQCRSSGDLLTFKQQKGSPNVILGEITDKEIEEDTHIGYTNKPCYWHMVPHVGDDGVMEVGKYIDFHETPHDNDSKYNDYSTRIVALAPTTKNEVNLPTISGQLIVRPSAGAAVGGPLQPVYINATGQTVVCNYFNMNDSGNYWNIIPNVDDNGVMEIGKYIDFHVYATRDENREQWDFGTRVQAQQVSEPNTVYLPSKGGLLIVAEQLATEVGSANEPVYIDTDGVVKACNTISAQYGGTGSAITDDSFKYFIPYFNNNNCLNPSKYYIDGDGWLFGKNNGDNGIGVAWRWGSATDLGGCNGWLYLGSNMTTKTRGLYDAGGAGLVIGFTGDNETNSYATIHGELVVKKNYGTYDPNITTPPVVEQGAIYFRIIS